MNRKTIIALALMVLLVLCAGVGTALAYFTAHTDAAGQVPIALGSTTTIDEPTVEDFVKHVVISNEGPESCYVRARAFSGSAYELIYSGSGWSDGGDGFWYYEGILAEGEKTTELVVEIKNVPEDAAEGDQINIAVVYEATKVLYNEDGSAKEPDWNLAAIVEGE